MTLITVQQPIFILSKTGSNLDKNNIIITIKNTWNTAPVIYRTCFACSANSDSVFF